MNKQHVKWVVLTLMVALLLTGCGEKNKALVGAPPSETPIATVTPTPTPTPDPTPTPIPDQTKDVKVYFTDDNLEELIEKVVTITYKEDADMYLAAFNALKSTDVPNMFSLFKNVTFNEVKLDGDALRVDLTLGEGAQLGAGGEMFFVQALKQVAFQFPEVKSLYVTRDGKKVESLMGHATIESPFIR
jgi:Sporulation and spore germination